MNKDSLRATVVAIGAAIGAIGGGATHPLWGAAIGAAFVATAVLVVFKWKVVRDEQTRT